MKCPTCGEEMFAFEDEDFWRCGKGHAYVPFANEPEKDLLNEAEDIVFKEEGRQVGTEDFDLSNEWMEFANRAVNVNPYKPYDFDAMSSWSNKHYSDAKGTASWLLERQRTWDLSRIATALETIAYEMEQKRINE